MRFIALFVCSLATAPAFAQSQAIPQRAAPIAPPNKVDPYPKSTGTLPYTSSPAPPYGDYLKGPAGPAPGSPTPTTAVNDMCEELKKIGKGCV
jgi:hypothetical protein